MKNTVLKDGEYKITADQLMQLENGFTLPKLKEWFPEVFKTKLEVGKWYKTFFKYGRRQWGIINVTGFEPEKIIYYGFLLGIYSKKDWCSDENIFKEATEQEVFEALKNEAVKLGFKENVFVKGLGNTQDGRFHYNPELNYLYCGSYAVFCDGKWHEISPTKTIKEAEELLNCKIID